MAIDTINEKFALITQYQPWTCAMPISADGLGQDDKQHLIWDYPGLLWTAAVITTKEPLFRYRRDKLDFVYNRSRTAFKGVF